MPFVDHHGFTSPGSPSFGGVSFVVVVWKTWDPSIFELPQERKFSTAAGCTAAVWLGCIGWRKNWDFKISIVNHLTVSVSTDNFGLTHSHLVLFQKVWTSFLELRKKRMCIPWPYPLSSFEVIHFSFPKQAPEIKSTNRQSLHQSLCRASQILAFWEVRHSWKSATGQAHLQEGAGVLIFAVIVNNPSMWKTAFFWFQLCDFWARSSAAIGFDQWGRLVKTSKSCMRGSKLCPSCKVFCCSACVSDLNSIGLYKIPWKTRK